MAFKVHLIRVVRYINAARRVSTACGLVDPTNSTRNVSDVTCELCVRTQYMAHEELRQSNRQPKRRRNKSAASD